MYYIDSTFDDPDINYMVNRVKENCDAGIAVYDNTKLYNDIVKARDLAALNMKNIYSIGNPNSPAQVMTYLENNMDANIEEACFVNGKLTTRADSLKILAHQGYQFATDLLTFRKAKKYAESIKSIMDYTEEGVVRPSISLGKTNRINYIEPALMNIPKKLLWNVIKPRREGNYLISVDIKNQEPWILINTLDIEMLKSVLSSKPGSSMYDIIFKHLYGKECNPIERKEFKTSWNALTYGATKKSVVGGCKNIDGGVIYKFFNSIPEFKDWKAKSYALARRKVQKVETYFGTELYANELGFALQRVLMDLPIQGTGTDILALLIKHADEEIEDRDLGECLSFYFSRHDELIFEASKEYVDGIGLESVYAELRNMLEHQVDDWEPFQVEVGAVEPEDILVYSDTDDEEDE